MRNRTALRVDHAPINERAQEREWSGAQEAEVEGNGVRGSYCYCCRTRYVPTGFVNVHRAVDEYTKYAIILHETSIFLILMSCIAKITDSPVDPGDVMLNHYLIATWAKVCQALGPEFEPYLPIVMPPLLEAASARADVNIWGKRTFAPSSNTG